MLHNEHDMDQVFRQAAERYPLKTDNADWERVAAALDEEQNRKGVPFDRQQSGYGRYGWLLLLFATLTGMAYLLFRDEPPAAAGKKPVQRPAVQHANTPRGVHTTTTAASASRNSDPAIAGNVDKQGRRARILSPQAAFAGRKSVSTASQNYDKLLNLPARSPANGAPEQSRGGDAAAPASLQQTTGTVAVLPASTAAPARALADSNRKPAENRQPGKVLPPVPSVLSRLYVMPYVAGDISAVKWKRFSRPGHAVGLLLGYQIDERWAVESGLAWSSKNYYSEAGDFKTTRMNVPAYYQFKNFEGECTMVEWPLHVKFRFSDRGEGWYTTGGFNSYFMNREEYDYTYIAYGQERKGNRVYRHSTRDWAAVLQLSGGYEKKLGKRSALRLASYLALPLQGSGIGSVPIGSVGVLAGYQLSLGK